MRPRLKMLNQRHNPRCLGQRDQARVPPRTLGRLRALRQWLGLSCLLTACHSGPADSRTAAEPSPQTLAYGQWGDLFATLPRGDELHARVCGGASDDLVLDVFCGDESAPITSLNDLELAVGLNPSTLTGITGASLTGHSSSLSVRSVSAINPRVILLRLEVPPVHAELSVLSFNRGEQFVELVARDRLDNGLRFYLVRFEQACNATHEGCVPGDLLTEAVESDWRNVALYDEAALANTVLDCAPCHQPDGPSAPKLLRMQEFTSPWTHWLFKSTEGGSALVDDYTAAKGDESVAGLPRDKVETSPPGSLQLFVGSHDHDQPNAFDSDAIEQEVRDSAAIGGGNQPVSNDIPGTSPTWRVAYERAQRGEAIPVPYHDVKVSDPDKLARLSDAYQAYRRGELARAKLPDLRDVFPDDPQRLAEMGMMTEPGLSGEAVLIQACSQCHNPRLDSELSRARFRADLEGLSRAEKQLAIARLSLPQNSILAMPPARLRVLSEEARARAIEVLGR